MNRLFMDQEKCRGCGKCEERCGFKKVIGVNGTGKAAFREDRDECVDCLHCLMVCPHDAISPDNGDTIEVSRVNGSTSAALTRHSCRVYAGSQVDKETLTGVIRDANLAPRAYIGFAERKYVVLTGEAMASLRAFILEKIERAARLFRALKKIPFLPRSVKANLKNLARCFTLTVEANREKEQIFHGAPAVVIVTGPGKNIMGRINSDFALMQLLICAEERGLGTCISGYINGYAGPIAAFLGMPRHETIFGGATIGYPLAPFPKYVRRNDTAITWM